MLDQILRRAEQCPEVGAAFKNHGKGKPQTPYNYECNENFGNDVEFILEYVAKNPAAEENHAELDEAETEQFKAQKYVFNLYGMGF